LVRTSGSRQREQQLMRAWWVVLVGAFAVDVVAAPGPVPIFFLIPGAV
jgi:hypothetical protein